MNTLTRYDQARFALAECQRVDEVKDIRDKAEAMAAYARQAKDTELVQWATEIKVRAERKAGEMLSQMELAKGGDPTLYQHVRGDRPQTLAEMGLTQNDSSRYQSLASMSEQHFETAVATAKETAGQVTTAFMLREAARGKPHGQPHKGAKADSLREELKAAKDRGVSQLETYARLTLSALRSQDSFTEQEQLLLAELMEVIAAMTAESAKP